MFSTAILNATIPPITFEHLLYGSDSIGTYYTMLGRFEDKYAEIYVKRFSNGEHLGHYKTYSQSVTTLSEQEAATLFAKFDALYRKQKASINASVNERSL